MRSFVSADLKPFYHGVASGDPLSDRVILWTRITPEDSSAQTVNWKVGTDTTFATIVTQGSVNTDASKDFSINVDATGLQPNSWYYYQFEQNGKKSLIGRTRTLPAGDVDSLRFGVVSCANYEDGFYNAYRDLADRNDLDAIIHLGDYIYEYKTGGFSSSVGGRTSLPENEIVTLSDYRTRYSHYHLDKDLMWLHQNYPFIITWDDHEVANNSWYDGAENHTDSTEGNYQARKAAAEQAHAEWIPIRMPEPGNNAKIFRRFRWGDLLTLHMVDTRHYARTVQEAASAPDFNDTTRYLLGPQQYDWFVNGMDTATTTWNVVGNQVMMAPLKIFGQLANTDQWDGYPAERNKLYNDILSRNIQNFVVLTGDIHTAWSMDLPHQDGSYNASTGQGSVGVEFVCTSITSQSSPLPVSGSVLTTLLPHIKYAELSRKGYYVLDVNKTRTQCDHNIISAVTDTVYTKNEADSRYTLAGERWLRVANSASVGDINPTQPPRPIYSSVGISNKDKNVFFGVFPNPFFDKFMLQFYTEQTGKISLSLANIEGKSILNETRVVTSPGIQYWDVNGASLPAGNYLLNFELGGKKYSRKVVKVGM